MARLELTDQFIESHPTPEKTTEIYDSRIKNLAIRIYKSGSKSFVYRYYLKGASKRFTIGKFPNYSTDQARIKAQQIYDKVQQGIDPIRERKKKQRQNNSITFKQAIDIYLKENKSKLAESTYNYYKGNLNNHLKKLHEIYLSELTRKDVMKVLRKKAEDSPSMADNLKNNISGVLSYCVEIGEIENNFMIGISEFAEKNETERFYEFDEIVELWEYIETFREPYQSYYKILFLSAQRKSETMHMKWKHLDTRKHVMTWNIPPELTKNGEPHSVPITPYIFRVLRNLKRNYSGNSEYVFQSPQNKNKPISTVYPYSKKIKNNTSVKDFINHHIRKTASTHMGNLGVFPFIIGRILNHQQEGEMNDVTSLYNRAEYMPEKRKALDKWNEYLIKYITAEKLNRAQTNTKAKGVKYKFDGELKEQSFRKDIENKEPIYKDLEDEF